MTMGGIRIAPEGLGHALADNQLSVPVYQRSYAWEETHVADLFHDITDAIAQSENEYFLGSIVVAGTDVGTGGDRPEVVDGQQRLATATILLAAIRDYFYGTNDMKRSEGIETEYLMKTDLRTQEIVPHLRLNEIDNDYFQQRILLRPDHASRKEAQRLKLTKDSHKKINAASKLAAKHVNDLVQPHKESTRADRLIDWVDYIREKARVIWVTVPDHANAFVIFETLNDRGLELSTSDLLKNYLFGRSGDRLKEVQQRWSVMSGALESASSDDITKMYIKHFWASTNGPVREKQLYSTIKDKVKNKQAAVDLATNLSDNAMAYAALLNSTHEHWSPYGSRTRRNIETLKMLRAEQMRPLLLAVATVFTVHEAKKAIRLLVCWAVRFLFAGGHGGGVLERAYAEQALKVRSGEIATASALASSMKDKVPTDSEFEAAFSIARVSQANLARYYLRAIEMHAEVEPEFEVNSTEDEVNLEHILPQVPGGNWPDFTPESADDYWRRIGNMILMRRTPNNELGNKSFEDKKKEYEKSSYPMTSAVAKFEKWTAAEIDKRQKDLALAVKTWPTSVA